MLGVCRGVWVESETCLPGECVRGGRDGTHEGRTKAREMWSHGGKAVCLPSLLLLLCGKELNLLLCVLPFSSLYTFISSVTVVVFGVQAASLSCDSRVVFSPVTLYLIPVTLWR